MSKTYTGNELAGKVFGWSMLLVISWIIASFVFVILKD
jgi:hypothetical protein